MGLCSGAAWSCLYFLGLSPDHTGSVPALMGCTSYTHGARPSPDAEAPGMDMCLHLMPRPVLKPRLYSHCLPQVINARNKKVLPPPSPEQGLLGASSELPTGPPILSPRPPFYPLPSLLPPKGLPMVRHMPE